MVRFQRMFWLRHARPALPMALACSVFWQWRRNAFRYGALEPMPQPLGIAIWRDRHELPPLVTQLSRLGDHIGFTGKLFAILLPGPAQCWGQVNQHTFEFPLLHNL